MRLLRLNLKRSLLVKKKRSGGRNDTGKMTIENIGGVIKKGTE